MPVVGIFSHYFQGCNLVLNFWSPCLSEPSDFALSLSYFSIFTFVPCIYCCFWWFVPAKYFSVCGIPCHLVSWKIFKNDFCLFLFVNLVSLFYWVILKDWKRYTSATAAILPISPNFYLFFKWYHTISLDPGTWIYQDILQVFWSK